MYNSSCQNSKLFTNFFSILICDGMKISVANIEFYSFFSFWRSPQQNCSFKCKLLIHIQGLLILTNIVGETGMNGKPVVQKGH